MYMYIFHEYSTIFIHYKNVFFCLFMHLFDAILNSAFLKIFFRIFIKNIINYNAYYIQYLLYIYINNLYLYIIKTKCSKCVYLFMHTFICINKVI